MIIHYFLEVTKEMNNYKLISKQKIRLKLEIPQESYQNLISLLLHNNLKVRSCALKCIQIFLNSYPYFNVQLMLHHFFDIADDIIHNSSYESKCIIAFLMFNIIENNRSIISSVYNQCMTSLISLLEIENEEIILTSLKILSNILIYYNIHNMNITKEQIEILEDLSM